MQMRSVMKHDFSKAPQANIPRSKFNRSFGHKTTFDAGYLIPVYLDEALPADTFNVNASMFARLNTPLYPIMDNLYLDTFFFAVPLRLLWDNFPKMMGEQTDPLDSTSFVVPQIVMPAGTGTTAQEVFDYFGVPIGVPSLSISALFSRAYNLIYNEWFRDENLIDSVTVDKDNGPDTYADYVLLKRCKRHDYFTSALPFALKDPDSIITIPLGSTAPVILGTNITGADLSGQYANALGHVTPSGRLTTHATYATAGSYPTSGSEHSLDVDLSNAVGGTINDLREAFQLQKMLEKDARGGSRYTEIIRSHFGVVSLDARLQRPEYLGGNTSPIKITPVPQTSSTDTGTSSQTPQGTLAGFGTVATTGVGFTKSFTEHCIIMGIVNVRADLTYQQGLNRMFSRSTRFDFYWPSLAHLGEQEVLQKEIYAVDPATDTDADGTPDNEEAFGYQERWAEYRYKPSQISGKLRSTYATSLDAWHLSQEFGASPTLSQTFIEEDPPLDRVVAAPSEPHFIYDSYFSVNCTRPMPTYSIPGLIDHF